MKTVWLALIAVFAAATIGLADAEAKRLGGGRNVGKQAPDSTMQRGATPAADAAAPVRPFWTIREPRRYWPSAAATG